MDNSDVPLCVCAVHCTVLNVQWMKECSGGCRVGNKRKADLGSAVFQCFSLLPFQASRGPVGAGVCEAAVQGARGTV